MCSAVSGILTRSTTSLTIMEINIMIKRLETEPSLVEPEPVERKYNVCWDDSDIPMNDEPFETREEATAFILDDLGLIILEVKPKK